MFRALIACALALAITGCATTAQPTVAASNPTPKGPACAPQATRLPQTECGPGSTYDQTQVSQTGQTNTAAALRMLDPRDTIR